MTRKQRVAFAVYCRMTCIGGSERGTCVCARPIDCTLQRHPEFPAARHEASVRMARWLLNRLNGQVPAQIQQALDELKGETTP